MADLFKKQMRLLGSFATEHDSDRIQEEVRNAPVFSPDVQIAAEEGGSSIFPEFGLLARRLRPIAKAATGEALNGTKLETPSETSWESSGTENSSYNKSALQDEHEDDPRLFLNVNTAWSAYICGSQGSGKSYSMSCILENCLLGDREDLGPLSKPLTSLVFNFDSFTSVAGAEACEAAHLASSGIKVRVLVSRSNLHAMTSLYKKVDERIEVEPFLLSDKYLTISTLLTLMACDSVEGAQPLYLQTVRKILREMACTSNEKGRVNLDYFVRQCEDEIKDSMQRRPLDMRLELLFSFVGPKQKAGGSYRRTGTDWSPREGLLTIVDLSDPFVDSDTACNLFDICLGIFLQQTKDIGRVIALDEAHRFLTESGAAMKLTDTLKSVVRQQRHQAARVIIATQEPTISPSLLDLCSITLIHRFTSPEWFKALRTHLAAISDAEERTRKEAHDESGTLFGKIVKLNTGEAILCAPSAMVDVQEDGNEAKEITKLGTQYIKIRMRQRITSDGGQTIMITR